MPPSMPSRFDGRADPQSASPQFNARVFDVYKIIRKLPRWRSQESGAPGEVSGTSWLVGVNFGAIIVTAGRLRFGPKGFQRQQNEPGIELLLTKVSR
jgi:hypothetical protein